MKSLPPLRLATALLTATGTFGVAQAQTRPYVETTSLTFLWNFVHSGVSTVTQAPGAAPGPILDPKTYDPTEPISTDTSSLTPYIGGNGDHDYIMRLIIQAFTRAKGFNLNEDYFIRDVDHNRDGSIADTDIDGDGDMENFDVNGDGVIRNADHNRDGILKDTDFNGDGTIEDNDDDENGIIQTIDRNGNRSFENIDYNNDGFLRNRDINGDQKFENVDTDKSGAIDDNEREFEIEIEGEIEVEAELEVEVERIPLLGKLDAPKNWQLTAVREVPRTVAEMATNPYTIYLTIIDRTYAGIPYVLTKIDEYSPEQTPDLAAITTTINTGITFTLGQWAASGTVREKYTGPVVTNASGKVTTAFTMNFGALLYEDPRYLAANNAEPHQYHLKRHVWDLFANGHIIYNIRSIPGPFGTNLNGTFYASNVDMTGTGWFRHQFLSCTAKEDPEGNYFIDEILDSSYAYSGLAPLRVKMGNIQYQNRNMFPDFGVTLPPPAP